MRIAIFLLLALVGASAAAQDFTRLYPDLQAMRKARAAASDGRYADAHDYYLEAAAYGNKEAQKYVGLEYIDGRGVEADPVQALAWLRLASTIGRDLRVVDARQELESSLTEAELAEADKHFKTLQKEYGDRQALKKRKLWARKELRNSASGGARRPNRMEQTQVQIDGRYFRVSMGEYMDALDAYADDFEALTKS